MQPFKDYNPPKCMQLYVAAKALPEAAGKLREGAGSLSDVLSSQLEVFRGLGFRV